MTMRLAVSNLAWPADQELAAFALLQRLGVQGIEVAPTRLAAWDALPEGALTSYRERVRSAGLAVSSLQAILFGLPDLQLLGEGKAFTGLLDHMRRVADIAAALGAGPLVFGSPRNRLTMGMPAGEAWNRARDRLRELGEIVAHADAVIGIEPVPAIYGGEFLASWHDVLQMVQDVDHPAVQVHLDTGCVTLGGDAIGEAIRTSSRWLAHFHAAEPQLAAFTNPAPAHTEAAEALKEVGYSRWMSIEMREQSDTPLQAIETAVQFAKSIYPL
jgi:sugar phosphate isomerase/epimerase